MLNLRFELPSYTIRETHPARRRPLLPLFPIPSRLEAVMQCETNDTKIQPDRYGIK